MREAYLIGNANIELIVDVFLIKFSQVAQSYTISQCS